MHTPTRIARENPLAVTNYVHKELVAGRIAGPFQQLPFKKSHVSPISLRPKPTPGLFRIIHDLSFPYDNKYSVNDGIPREEATVEYATL